MKGGNNMRYHTVFVQWILLLVLLGASVFAEEGMFVPTEEQQALLREGAEYAKKLEERYSNITMAGTTERFYSNWPEGQQRFIEHFRFVRLGHESCLLEVHGSMPGVGRGEPELFHTCRLINSKAYYQFVAQGQNDPPTFALGEKINFENHEDLAGTINYLVHVNWETGSAPYSVSVDLSCPFDISTARAASPKQGGYIKGITEEVVDGKRVVTLNMGYYYGTPESNGKVSFYRDHHWAVKDATIESIRSDTEKVDCICKTNNVYDFSDTFPKLTKTTIETWDADGTTLLKSEISTITSIDFTEPDVEVFDPKRYVGGKPIDQGEVVLTKQRFSSWQIAGIIAGILLIVWGLWMRLAGKKEV